MADTPHTRPVAFWLVPSQPQRSRFAALIERLGAEHRGPAFEPHVTIEVNRACGGASLEELLARVAGAFEPMTLTAGGTGHSGVHFKTLYVELDDPRVFALQRALRDALGRDEGYVLRPHLSLLYRGGLARDARERLAEAHRFDGERIEFDSLVVVRPPASGGDLSDIEALDTTLRARLGPQPRPRQPRPEG